MILARFSRCVLVSFLGANYEREDIAPGGRTQDDNSASKRNCALVLARQVIRHLHAMPCYYFAPESQKTMPIICPQCRGGLRTRLAGKRVKASVRSTCRCDRSMRRSSLKPRHWSCKLKFQVLGYFLLFPLRNCITKFCSSL